MGKTVQRSAHLISMSGLMAVSGMILYLRSAVLGLILEEDVAIDTQNWMGICAQTTKTLSDIVSDIHVGEHTGTVQFLDMSGVCLICLPTKEPRCAQQLESSA